MAVLGVLVMLVAIGVFVVYYWMLKTYEGALELSVGVLALMIVGGCLLYFGAKHRER